MLLRPIGNTVYFMPPYVVGDARVRAARRGGARHRASVSGAPHEASRSPPLLLALPLLAAARDIPAPVQAELARAGVPLDAVSVIVASRPRAAPPSSPQRRAPMNPASVIKLVTTYAALDLFGPAFTFKTHFVTTGEIAQRRAATAISS